LTINLNPLGLLSIAHIEHLLTIISLNLINLVFSNQLSIRQLE